EIRKATHALAKDLKVVGLMNIQYAVKDSRLFILEVNPRASRTVPFISKATGLELAKAAAKVMAGKTLLSLGIRKERDIKHISVKESVLPFSRFSGVDILLGPEMKSTGEVMGVDSSFGIAYYKSQAAAGQHLPTSGKVFLSVRNEDKRNIVFIAKKLHDMRFEIVATDGTAKVLHKNNIPAAVVGKISDGFAAIPEWIKTGKVHLIINTPSGSRGHSDMSPIRSLAVLHGVPCVTTLQGAQAAVNGIEAVQRGTLGVRSIQEYLRTAQKT
ncbi:MAG: ATP-grasp domain-containing protein, partial [Candidatus Omnitrophota bacterium]